MPRPNYEKPIRHSSAKQHLIMSLPRFHLPPHLVPLAIASKLQHYHARTLLLPTMTPESASAQGFRALSKPASTRNYEKAMALLALKQETEREFDVVVVAVGDRVALWKRSRIVKIAA